MRTVTLKIEDNIYEKFTWLLNHFSRNEVEVIDETKYLSDDDYLRSIEGMEQSIIQASNEPSENFVTADKLDW
jgi:hypothetical protein